MLAGQMIKTKNCLEASRDSVGDNIRVFGRRFTMRITTSLEIGEFFLC